MSGTRDYVGIGHSTNLVGIPTGLLASIAFNDYPLPLHISGVRETNRGLFALLEKTENREDAAEVFCNYMGAVFGLEESQRQPGSGGQRRFRASYLRLLQGWGFDSSGPAGAVLKGWVESRFGLFPVFHGAVLGRYPSPAWIAYLEQKLASRFHNNSIHVQLDLLYEYCQWALAHHIAPAKRHLRLYRGVNGFDEHPVIERIDKRQAVIRLNNLVSFTSRREVADQFGDAILEADVPVAKLLFSNDLLPTAPLKGEGEFLVIGGDYRVRVAYF